ncbi:hypothetical protein L6164_016021 [Bauhinia variegata]|uniref:Uncharacterized protein n=1 Tax=Bauhinia variegata TaxID=167791 RepID=A0ACB9NMC6_BAUVA|nr:hypothetical protein L6164_016021 [Bauhinia variegata]
MSSLVPDLDSSSDSCTYNDKPPIEELRQFLEFQLPRQRALVFSGLPLGPQRRQLSSASLQRDGSRFSHRRGCNAFAWTPGLRFCLWMASWWPHLCHWKRRQDMPRLGSSPWMTSKMVSEGE